MPQNAEAPSRTDLTIDRKTFSIRLTRVFEASSADIFQAWTQPEHLSLWWDPAGDPLAECAIDLRVGGAFRFVSRSHPDRPFDGVYREIAPPGRLVFDANGARGVVALRFERGKTHMLVEITCRSAEHLDQYIQFGVHIGTTHTLDNLVAYAAERFATAA